MDIIETIKSFFGGNKVEIIDGIEFKGKEIKALHRYKEKLNERLSVTKLYIREKNIESEEVRVNLLNKTRIIAVLYCFNTELDMKKLKCVDEIIRAMDNDVFMKYIYELEECNSIELTSDNKVGLKHITKFLHYNSIEMPKEISSEEDNKDEDFIEVEIRNIEEKQDVVDESMESENENNNDVEVIEEEEIENIAEKEEDVEGNKDVLEKEEEVKENKEVPEKEEGFEEKEEDIKEKKNIIEKETKSEKKGNRTVTKLKEENEEIKEKILIALKNKNDFITIKEIRKDEYSLGLSQCTSQKISALIRQLVEDGKVERVSEKKVIRFKIK
ncbi:hypothetical protein KQI30_09715 [Clostridium bornimense]|uniref:hypothetical protein n=1 Tax=Clostridium bornimense TaxID=1216932 RepID=UPI001C128C45|nr:hypothetical protein [Clostridium bornimense]MBU5316545.1 hypothetical protein [Clostridium bornimense]